LLMKHTGNHVRRSLALAAIAVLGLASSSCGPNIDAVQPRNPGRVEDGYMKQVSSADAACEFDSIPVMMYHTFNGNSDYSIHLQDFEKQLDYLEEQGYHTLTLDELIGFSEGKLCPTSPKMAALTFDDGYTTLYTMVGPDLKLRGLHGIAFIDLGITELTDSQIKKLADSGVIEIESHLMTHTTSDGKYTDQEMSWELAESKVKLESMTGKPVIGVSWPGGYYRDGDIDRARNEGYKITFGAWGRRAVFGAGTDEVPRLDVVEFVPIDQYVKTLTDYSFK
jgi:peptidoglycan/xylan/chitin deacetylase (PgdA/CDA1 family)